MVGGLVVAGGVVLGVLAVAGIYNRLVALRNRYLNAFSQIDVQLQRRHDLVPNLVESVKGYMKHERETLEAVVEARNFALKAMSRAASSPGDAAALAGLAGAEGALSSALGRLLAVVENYPDLKASENMRQFQEELSSTENKVAFARQAYNDSVRAYNIGRQAFPAMLFAASFGFMDAQFLEFEGTAFRRAPAVSFG